MSSKFFFLFGVAGISLLSLYATGEERYFYSTNKQDSYLYENVFDEKRNGVFVDIGAHDGVTGNNTYFFEKHMGWSGICVEAVPELFARLKKNRRSVCIQGCISQTCGTKPFLRVICPFPSLEMLSGLVEKYTPVQVARLRKKIAASGGKTEIITMPCFTLNKILSKNRIKHIDYLTIDTDGDELEILKSIDYSRFEIDVLEVENTYKSLLWEMTKFMQE